MTAIASGIANFMLSAGSFGLKGVALITVVGLGFAYVTKPSDESFKNDVAPKGTGILGRVATTIAINTVAPITFKDWVVVKTASVDGKIEYIGIFNNWLPANGKK